MVTVDRHEVKTYNIIRMKKVKKIVRKLVSNQLETTALKQIASKHCYDKGDVTYSVWFWLNGQFRGRCKAVDNCTLYIHKILD